MKWVIVMVVFTIGTSAHARDYDPIPAAWNRKINLPGELSVGADYCTQMGKCTHVGDSALMGLCLNRPDAEPCMQRRVKVHVLAASPAGTVIVRLNGKNYAAGGGHQWAKKMPDGYVIGGPVSVFMEGRSVPLQLYLQGNR